MVSPYNKKNNNNTQQKHKKTDMNLTMNRKSRKHSLPLNSEL